MSDLEFIELLHMRQLQNRATRKDIKWSLGSIKTALSRARMRFWEIKITETMNLKRLKKKR